MDVQSRMPKGKREVFTVRLTTDRHQRKALDEFVKKAQGVITTACDELKSSLSLGILVNLEELADRMAVGTDLHRETLLHACVIAQERVRAVLGGEIDGRSKRSAMMFAIGGSSVMFSVFEKKVSIPHVGLCSYKRNMFILAKVEGTEAKQLAMTPYRVELGYFNNEPVLTVDTVDRTPIRAPLPEQKLVRVVRKPKA